MILSEIIKYLKGCLDTDTDITQDINVLEAYKYSHRVNSTEIQVYILDHSEYAKFTTFENGRVYISPLQIDIYAEQMEIGNELVSAQKASYILAQKIIDYLDIVELKDIIPDIQSIRNATYTTALPLQTGTNLYRATVRVDLYLEHN